MCFAKFTLGSGACDYNVSICQADDGRSRGRRFFRGATTSDPDGPRREMIAQIFPRSDDTWQVAINQNFPSGSWKPQPAQVRGSRIVWAAPTYAASSVNRSLNNTMALLSGDRTAFADAFSDNTLHCYDADGVELWSVPPPVGGALSSTIATDGTDVFGTYQPAGDVKYAIAFAGDDGTELWRTRMGLVENGGTDTIGAVDGDVLVIGNVTGGNIWRYNSAGARVGTGVVGTTNHYGAKRSGDYVWGTSIFFPLLFAGDTDLAQFLSLDLQPEIETYEIPTPTGGFGSGVRCAFVDSSGAYAAFFNGIVMAYDLDGTFRWWNRCYREGDVPEVFTPNDIVVHDGRVYVVHDVIPGSLAPTEPLPE